MLVINRWHRCLYKKTKNLKKYDFYSPDGKFCCIAHRIECRDSIGIYSTQNWGKALEFPTNTMDLADIKYSPDGSAIAVIDTELNYTIHLFIIYMRVCVCVYGNILHMKMH